MTRHLERLLAQPGGNDDAKAQPSKGAGYHHQSGVHPQEDADGDLDFWGSNQEEFMRKIREMDEISAAFEAETGIPAPKLPGVVSGFKEGHGAEAGEVMGGGGEGKKVETEEKEWEGVGGEVAFEGHRRDPSCPSFALDEFVQNGGLSAEVLSAEEKERRAKVAADYINRPVRGLISIYKFLLTSSLPCLLDRFLRSLHAPPPPFHVFLPTADYLCGHHSTARSLCSPRLKSEASKPSKNIKI
jgi:hypothetical protein